MEGAVISCVSLVDDITLCLIHLGLPNLPILWAQGCPCLIAEWRQDILEYGTTKLSVSSMLQVLG